jgi:hypothetical protein
MAEDDGHVVELATFPREQQPAGSDHRFDRNVERPPSYSSYSRHAFPPALGESEADENAWQEDWRYQVQDRSVRREFTAGAAKVRSRFERHAERRTCYWYLVWTLAVVVATVIIMIAGCFVGATIGGYLAARTREKNIELRDAGGSFVP